MYGLLLFVNCFLFVCLLFRFCVWLVFTARPVHIVTAVLCFVQNVRNKKYHSREAFLNDVNQIVENSKLYNGKGETSAALTL